MSDLDAKVVVARQQQSSADKKALKSKLLGKKARTKDIEVTINGEKLELKFRALSAHDLDALTAKYPPTNEQRASGMSFNPETFAPALVQACLIDPELTLEEVEELWASDHWSTGELNALFNVASELCMDGLNIPFTASV